MRRMTMFQTSDGLLHETQEQAARHADRRYGNALTSLVHKLCRIEKYAAMSAFVDENLSRFNDLAALKADVDLVPPEGDE